MLGKRLCYVSRIEPTGPNNDASQVGNAPRDILKHTNRLQAEHVSAAGEDGSEDEWGRSNSSDSDADGPASMPATVASHTGQQTSLSQSPEAELRVNIGYQKRARQKY